MKVALLFHFGRAQRTCRSRHSEELTFSSVINGQAVNYFSLPEGLSSRVPALYEALILTDWFLCASRPMHHLCMQNVYVFARAAVFFCSLSPGEAIFIQYQRMDCVTNTGAVENIIISFIKVQKEPFNQ